MTLLHYTFQYFFYDDNEIEGLFDEGMLPIHEGKWYDYWFHILYKYQICMCLVPLVIWIFTHVAYKVMLYDQHRGKYTIAESIELNRKY